jgi:hypothetical protein
VTDALSTVVATPETVAAILRARTKDSSGQEIGQWTTETRPTLAQVNETIAIAQTVVAAHVGDPVTACQDKFAIAVCFEAACIIEKSYWPEQIESARSQYDQLRAETDALVLGVKDCQEGNLPDGAEASWRVYDVCTPYDPCNTGGWPYDWWQRNYDQVP